MKRRVAGAVTAVVILSLCFCGVFLNQWGAYLSGKERLRECIDAANHRLTQIHAAEPRIAQVEKELAKQHENLRKIRLILPESLDPDQIVSDLNEVSSRVGLGVEVQINGSREKTDDLPHKSEI